MVNPAEPATKDVVREALQSLSRVSRRAAEAYRLTALGSTEAGSHTIRATPPKDAILAPPPKGAGELVFRLISQADRLPDPAAAFSDLPHVTPQASVTIGRYLVVQRPYLATLFTARHLIRKIRTFGYDKSEIRQLVNVFFGDGLAGLNAIHNEGLVHGDLRPEKFGFLPGNRLAIRDVGVRYGTRYKEPRYVAPEILHDGMPPSRSTDVYAFLTVAKALLEPFRNDGNEPELADLRARIGWLHDYLEPRWDRPSAQDLRDFLVSGTHSTSNVDWFLDAYNSALPYPQLNKAPRPSGLKDLGLYLKNYPETRFAIDGSESGKRLATWLARAESAPRGGATGASPHSEVRVLKWRRNHPKGRDFPRESFKLDVDHTWMNSIHRMLFGFPIDVDHEKRMQQLPDEEIPKRQIFLAAIESATAARQTLLAEHDFLSTREAIEAMAGSGAELKRQEFMVLRRWGFVLAVPDHGRWLYPEFQFRKGFVSPRIREVHELLHTRRGHEPNPWSELDYWSAPRTSLRGMALYRTLWEERLRRNFDIVCERAVV